VKKTKQISFIVKHNDHDNFLFTTYLKLKNKILSLDKYLDFQNLKIQRGQRIIRFVKLSLPEKLTFLL